jgi:ABC-type branched-subunit amino acid transport system substrate-binding protein
LASRIGHLLGAASACPNVARLRIKSISDTITAVIKSSAVGEDESKTVLDLFNTNYLEGSRSVTTQQTDCAAADRNLADLESASAPAPTPQIAAPQINVMTPAQSAAFATQVAVGPIHGVSDSEIRFGISAPFSGPAKDLGHQMRVGIETAFRIANETGGINGRTLRLVTADDGYEPSRTGETMKQLYDQEQVFGFIGNVGTPTAAVAAPFALERGALFYGAFTGANVLRNEPPDRYVFNYRASYAEETDAVVH